MTLVVQQRAPCCGECWQVQTVCHRVKAVTPVDTSAHDVSMTRKAAFAGFHNDALYPVLEPAIGPLVALLADDEDKTRSNAAGALGNLVRNSNLLCRAMLRNGALEVSAQQQPSTQHRLHKTACLHLCMVSWSQTSEVAAVLVSSASLGSAGRTCICSRLPWLRSKLDECKLVSSSWRWLLSALHAGLSEPLLASEMDLRPALHRRSCNW